VKINYPYDFQRLWSAYPLKVGKGAALRAFEKLKPDSEDVDELILHLEERKKYDAKWVEGKYIPHLSSWLNGHRWEDEYQRVRPSAPANGKPIESTGGLREVIPEDEVNRAFDALAELRRTLH